MFGLFSPKWNPDGKHVYVTGGSTGLGLSLAELLARKGANVSIVARDQKKLDDALARLEGHRQTPSQQFRSYSYALDNAAGATQALEAVCEPYGGTSPDAIFTCAGASKPKFFVEMSEQELIQGMQMGYWVQAWTAWAAAKKMAKENKKGGKIAFVASTLAYMSFVGYASYSPAKHALRGLADTLRSEFLLYDIGIHIFFPPTMVTPGYEEENKTKPGITKKIEESDEGLTPENAARALLHGVETGEFHIAGDLITKLFRASTRGAAPRSNWILDGLLDFVAYIATPVWRSSVDSQVAAHREEHQEYLRQNAFFK